MDPTLSSQATSHRPLEEAAVLSPRRGVAWRLGVLAAFLAVLVIFLPGAPAIADDPFQEMRRDMVDQQVRQRGITQPRILSALEQVPRHRFVPEALGDDAYDDDPVAVGSDGQTLPQSYVSARMLDLLDLDGDETVLEVGTGTGYDAAVLSLVAREVYTVEIDDALARKARDTLRMLGYDNVFVLTGDGYRGWPEKAPFDAILLTAATPRVPEPLFDQLAPGGRMVVAVGSSLHQDLMLVTKTNDGERRVRRTSLVSLSPMTGEVQSRDRETELEGAIEFDTSTSRSGGGGFSIDPRR